jgi:hypothetical protein
VSDPGPRQEVEKAKLSGNRRGVGWVHSTGETLEQSREERWRRGRREGTQSEEEVDAEARPGHSAGFGVSQEAPIRGSNLNGPPKPRTSITFDLRQEPGAGKPHAGICGGGAGYPAPLPDSRENKIVSGADVFRIMEGNTDGSVMRAPARPGVV